MIRATVPGLKLMNKFLLRLVNVNRANDQPYLNRELGNLLITDDCQYLYNQSFDENILSGRKRNQRKGLTTAANRSDSNSDSKSYSGPEVDATMCYLPELLFQNGFMAFTCPVKDKTKEVSVPPDTLLSLLLLTKCSKTLAYDLYHTSRSSY